MAGTYLIFSRICKRRVFCFRYADFYFRYGESTSAASQQTSKASQLSKEINKVPLLLQNLMFSHLSLDFEYSQLFNVQGKLMFCLT